ncbi:MAG: T9SS type A sorting domain-containing protein [Bacteroidetes bacterium]|nr:T9SS type A sorting domain-containing protein [Bacteroidota bacterium]
MRTLGGISINFSNCGPRIGNVSSTISQVLFPNPARENVNIQFSSTIISDFQITLVDQAGRMIASEMGIATEGTNLKSLNIETLSSGIYSIVIRLGNDVQQSRLLVE